MAPGLPMTGSDGPQARTVAGRLQRSVRWPPIERLTLALVAYLPQLLSRPGVVDTDTKTYLYLAPATVLRRAASMWDPSMGLGTVTHEAIGYLWPIGPFFWLAHVLGIPLWAAQRLWVGTLLFAAGAGVLFLCRVVGIDGPGRFVAGFAFMLSPYFLQYVGRISVLLLPWAGIGWLTGVGVLALRNRGWRYPALFALVFLTMVGNDPVGALYAGLAPLLWVAFVLVTRQQGLREVWAPVWRTVVLTGAVSVWWVLSFLIEGSYGLSVLTYTEQPSHIASSSLASEVIRGLGYWYYYGYDNGGPWANTWPGYSQHVWLLAASLGVPLLGIAAAVVVRWRYRAFFVLLTLGGVVLAVGAHPYATPSIAGAALKYVMTHTTVGLAMRSTDRATPLVVLGVTVLLGAGASALARWRPKVGRPAGALAVAVVALANPSVWDGGTVPSRYTMPDPLPAYVGRAASALDAQHRNTRVLAIPGQNFAAYTYGDTTDPVWPGILSRPFVTREQFPLGSLPTYDLLYGLDDPMQDGTMDPRAIAPVARLMSAGDVLVQNDLDYALYGQPQPRQFWQQLQPSPPGLGPAVGYGTPRPNPPSVPMLTPATLATTPSATWPAPLEVMAVSDPRSLVRAESASGSLVVDGDGVGLADIAPLGLLDTNASILYSATLAQHPKLRSTVLSRGSTFVVTDSNRKQTFLWSRLQGNAGPTLSAKSRRPATPLDIFGTSPHGTQTTSNLIGVSSVTAQPDVAVASPAMAIDGSDETAWLTQRGVLPLTRWWEVKLTHPVTTDHVTVLQPTPRDQEVAQWITTATLTFDGGSPFTVRLGAASRSGAGQVVSFPVRTFRTLRVTIDATNLVHAPTGRVEAASAVGLAEVGIDGIRARQVTSMPDDLLGGAGKASLAHRVVVAMTRDRATDNVPAKDPEPVLSRSFVLPTTRTFTLSGTARVDSSTGDTAVDALVGRTSTTLVAAYSSSRITGSVDDTASAALDGTTATFWSPELGTGNQIGAWLQVDTTGVRTLEHLDLSVLADRRHSVPTRLRIQACRAVQTGGTCPPDSDARTVDLPAVTDSERAGATATLHVAFPAITGQDFTFTFTGVRIVKTTDYVSKQPIGLPLGIAELGFPGVRSAAAPASIDGACRSDLLQVDGQPLSVRLTGSTGAALSGGGLALVPCGTAGSGLTLSAGTHVIGAADGASTGLDVDQLVLDSAAGGGASAALGPQGSLAAPPSTNDPNVTMVRTDSAHLTVHVTGATGPFWMVLGESLNNGWRLSPTRASAASPVLVDGFANGWLVDPGPRGASGGTLTFTMTWSPQHTIDWALLLSGLAILVCLVLAIFPRWRRSVALEDDPPTLAPRPRPGEGVAAPEAMVIAGVTGVLGALLLPGPGLAVGAFIAVFLIVLLALVTPERRLWLRALPIGLLVATILYTVVEQATEGFRASGWLAHFERASQLVWFALVLLVADVVVGMVQHRRGTR